jgi:hypothetical protein
MLVGEQPGHKTSRISTARSNSPLKFTAMFHTKGVTYQRSSKGYICCLNGFAHLRLSVAWGDYLEVHYLQPKLPHVWIEKNTQNSVFWPRHCSEDCVHLRIPFPMFERKLVLKRVLCSNHGSHCRRTVMNSHKEQFTFISFSCFDLDQSCPICRPRE